MLKLRDAALAALTAVLLLAPGSALAAKRAARARCTGTTPCRACKNCRYCKHCAKDGGTCGVCRRRHGDQKSWEQARRSLTDGQ
jgi:hypothetical protein